MRALCGAIITCGALIGLGLTAMGIGERYATVHRHLAPDQEYEPVLVRLGQMDRPLIFILVFLVSAAIVGLGIAFFGLASHHARREREYAWERERHQRTTV